MNQQSPSPLTMVLCALLLCALAGREWTYPIPALAGHPVLVMPSAPTIRPGLDPARLAQSARGTREKNPFRVSRRPPAVEYSASMANQVMAAPVSFVSRPVLRLTGVLGGPPWAALIDGVPDVSGGLLISEGDSAQGMTLIRIRGDTVVLSAFDTTYVLTLKDAW